MNYEPTQKYPTLLYGECILQIFDVHTQHPSCYRSSSFEMSIFPTDTNSWLRFANLELLPYGEQNINDYAERPASALAGGQLKKLWWLSLLKRLTSRFPSIPQQAQGEHECPRLSLWSILPIRIMYTWKRRLQDFQIWYGLCQERRISNNFQIPRLRFPRTRMPRREAARFASGHSLCFFKSIYRVTTKSFS